MKIAFFANTYLPNRYGSTNSVEYFRKGLESLGHSVFVFAPRAEGYTDENKKVIRYPSIQWEYKIKYPLAITFYPPADLVIKKLNLDLVHCHQPFNLGMKGLKMAKKINVPLVFTHHCKYEEYTHYVPLPIQGKIKKFVINRATKFANQCNQIIAPSSAIKKLIQERGVKTPIEIIPTGINWKKFQSGKEKRNFIRGKYNIKEKDTLLLNVGRLENEKNIDFLFNGAIEILKNDPTVKFMLAGEGSKKEALIKKAKNSKLGERIVFLGLLKQEEIQNYYAAGDIFIHSSLSETQGMTINESMAAGCPTVAIKASGVEDSIKDNFSGMLTQNNKEAFISSINNLIKSPEKRLMLSENAQKEAKKIDQSVQAKKMETIYKKLVK